MVVFLLKKRNGPPIMGFYTKKKTDLPVLVVLKLKNTKWPSDHEYFIQEEKQKQKNVPNTQTSSRKIKPYRIAGGILSIRVG